MREIIPVLIELIVLALLCLIAVGSQDGDTELICASRHGHYDVVSLLLHHTRVNPNAINKVGFPVHEMINLLAI